VKPLSQAASFQTRECISTWLPAVLGKCALLLILLSCCASVSAQVDRHFRIGVEPVTDPLWPAGVFYYVCNFPGAACDGVSEDTVAVSAALHAAQLTGGVVVFDNVVWTPPPSLPSPNAHITLLLRNKLTVRGTLTIGSRYHLKGGMNLNSPNVVFSMQQSADIVPSPCSISPVVRFEGFANSGESVNIESRF